MTQIQIRSHGGSVILGGSVRSQAEKLLAEKVAEGIEGVQKVENNLSIGEASAGDGQSTSSGAGLAGTRPR
jgi:osmotically-inducible protein OsmY